MVERWFRMFGNQRAVGKIALVVGTLIGVQIVAGMLHLPSWFRSDLLAVLGPVLLLILVFGVLFGRTTGRGGQRWR